MRSGPADLYGPLKRALICGQKEFCPLLVFQFGKPAALRAKQLVMEVLPISKQELQINEQIRDKEPRVIDSDGNQLGIMSLRQALEIAEQKNLDLVKIAPQANPPVCKIIDYGKFRFEQAKREKEARKRSAFPSISIPTILRPKRTTPCGSFPKAIRSRLRSGFAAEKWVTPSWDWRL